MHDAKRRVAVANVVNKHPHSANVVERVESAILALHLPPDAVDMFGPAADVRLDVVGCQFSCQDRLHLGDKTLALAAFFLERFRQRLVGLRVQVAECQVFQLPFELPDAQAVGEGGIDFASLDRECLLYLNRCRLGFAHAMQLLCDPHEHQSHVRYHGKQHLSERFRLRSGERLTGLPIR